MSRRNDMRRVAFIALILLPDLVWLQTSGYAAPLSIATRPSTVPATGPARATSRPTQEAINLAVLQSHNLIAAGQYAEVVQLLDACWKYGPTNRRLNLAIGYSLQKAVN